MVMTFGEAQESYGGSGMSNTTTKKAPWYESLFKTDGDLDFTKIAGLGGLAGSALGFFDSSQPSVGYQGSIPNYTAMRSRVPNTFDPNRRPGSGGQRYFSDVQYVPQSDAGTPQATQSALATEVAGLAALNRANPANQVRPPSVIPDQPTIPTPVSDTGLPTIPTIPSPESLASSYTSPYQAYATGGIAKLQQGKYLDGKTDGMADEIPAMIDNEQPAMLSDGEFVIPADVVSHLGNGNSDAGAEVLEDMMDRVRKARTGTTKQGPEIDPKEFLPA
jgi:hypothetical protein